MCGVFSPTVLEEGQSPSSRIWKSKSREAASTDCWDPQVSSQQRTRRVIAGVDALDDVSQNEKSRTFFPWTMRPLDDEALGICVPWTCRP